MLDALFYTQMPWSFATEAQQPDSHLSSGDHPLPPVWATHAMRRPWRSSALHLLLLLACFCTLLNVVNTLVPSHYQDMATYALDALCASYAAASQYISRPLGGSRSLSIRWGLWAVYFLLRGVQTSCVILQDSGLTHLPYVANQLLLSGCIFCAYVVSVSPAVEDHKRRLTALDLCIGAMLGALYFTVNHLNWDLHAGRVLATAAALQLLFAGGSVLGYLSSTKFAERRLAMCSAVFFCLMVCFAGAQNLYYYFPQAPGAAYSNALDTLPLLAVIALTAHQSSHLEPMWTLRKRLPGSSRLVLTTLAVFVLLPLLLHHVLLGMGLALAVMALFAIRLSLMQHGFEQERTAFEAGHRKLTEQASTDPLLGIANRRSVFEELETLLQEARAAQCQLTLVLFDLDGLKQINDNQGHLAGDACLGDFAEAVHHVVSPSFARFGRLGGDEFTLLLRNVAAVDAQAMISDLRTALAITQVRFSAGIACCVSGGTCTATELLAEADAQLYQIKRARKRLRA
jgi:diguanylate cyclase (GGDEF)-like protein